MRWTIVLALLACSHRTSPPGASDAPSCMSCVASDAPSSGSGTVGAPCTKDGDCPIDVFGTNQGECIQQSPFTNGYCSARIGECPAPGGPGSPCPLGSQCINPGIQQTGGLDYCVARCASDADCRVADGYTCCANVEGHAGPFCYPTALCF